MSRGFDTAFETEILAGASRDFCYRRVVKRVLVDTDCWSTNSHRFLWGIVKKLGEGDTLTGSIVARAVDEVDDDEAEEILTEARRVLTIAPKAKHYAVGELNEWVRATRMKGAMSEAIKLLSDGRITEAEESLRRTVRGSSLSMYDAGDWFEEFDSRMAERERIKKEPDLHPQIATRIDSLDSALNGGIRVTEVGLLVAHTGRGKSATATHCAFYSATAGNPTIYISTEMNRELVDTRFDAKFFGKPTSDFTASRFGSSELEEFKAKRKRLRLRLSKKLRTVSVPVRTLTKGIIEEILDEYERDHGSPVQMLVIDSPDHMRPPPGVREYRLQHASNYWDIKQIAEERKLVAWATTQAPKEFISKLITAEGTAESYDKAQIADIIVTLNQTPAEKKLDLLRAYVAKNRMGEMGQIIYLATDFARMHIEETTPPGGRST